MTNPQRPLLLAQVLERLADQKFSRNRAALAEAAGISPSALSQYIRGRSLPSIEVLVRLATELQVSLDYLVLGEDALPPTVADFAGTVAQVESALRDSQARSAVLYELVARIGARVEGQIRQIAEDLVPEAAAQSGVLSPAEIARLERSSRHTRNITTTLDEDVVVVRRPRAGDVTAPGVIGQTVIENLRAGKEYEYIVPDTQEQMQRALMLVQLVRRQLTEAAWANGRRLQIFLTPRACLPGFVVHEIDVAELESTEREIYDRVSPFLYFDPDGTGTYLGAVEPPSRSMQNFVLIASRDVPTLLTEHAWLRSHARRLGIGADGASTHGGTQ